MATLTVTVNNEVIRFETLTDPRSTLYFNLTSEEQSKIVDAWKRSGGTAVIRVEYEGE